MTARISDWLRRFNRKLIGWPHQSRQALLMKARQSYEVEQFVSSFRNVGSDEDIAKDVWSMLSSCAEISDFKPMPEDDLDHVFGLMEEDLDEDILHVLLIKHNCRVPNETEMEGFDIVTVGDIVRFITVCKI